MLLGTWKPFGVDLQCKILESDIYISMVFGQKISHENMYIYEHNDL